MTSLCQGLSSLALGGGERETLGTRLDNKYSPYCVKSIILDYVCYLERLTERLRRFAKI